MSIKLASKPVIAIVGGIGSGKSTVAKLFAQSGGALFDADALVHELFKEDAVKNQIRGHFGATVFDVDGNLLRSALAKTVFADDENRLFLESILHPLVLKKAEDTIGNLAKFSESSFLVLDIPLLLEKEWRYLCTYLVFVACNDEERLSRCKARGWTEADWKNREKAQMPLTNKVSFCDHIIDNSVSYEYTVKQVNDLLKLWNLP